MFTLQAHNQLSTALNTWRPNISPLAASKKSSGLRIKQQKKLIDLREVLGILFDSSLFEELNRFKKVVYQKLSTWNATLFQQESRHKEISAWKVSFVSARTFDKNKQCFCRHVVTFAHHGSSTISHQIFRNSGQNVFRNTSFIFNSQVRPITSNRRDLSTTAGLGSFNIVEKIRKFLSLPDKITPRTVTNVKDPEKISVTPSDETKVIPDFERFKALLAEQEKNPEVQHKMKLAFAEGYIAGTGLNLQTRTTKFFKIIQNLLVIVMSLVIFISFLTIFSGSSFRLQLGNHIEVDPEDINVTFNDVKGADSAKDELREVVEFLKFPEKFSVLGGKLPKGVLLVGPPGTGKTLLARAVAGEAGVPFFHAAGPEFDEILVGQGARRVRDLFKAAKENSPSVIFIDEIDSVGSKRTNSVLHPYANQTINQLLSEMDGFHQNEGVIVLGATNRRDDLDKALLRPGRFDVEITVPVPDYTGRKEILELYLKRVQCKDINVELLARGSTGFTGADLENMVNQAALRAAIEGASYVAMKHIESARDKVLMGPERKSRIPDEEANTITAYHEGGHAVVAYYTKDSHPLHKVTIIPRGPSLGHTAYIPEKERYHVTKSQLLALMDTMMGGRAAEELVFGPEKITSGASSDLIQATAIATHMVRDWGMSEKVGLRTYPSTDAKHFATVNEMGPVTTETIDGEIKRLLSESYERAKAILLAHQQGHRMLAEALLSKETLDADEIHAIMKDSEKPSKGTKSKAPRKS